jgi:hypothetical protein
MRYLKGTEDLGMLYSKSDNFALTCYVDSDWCGDIDDRKSTTGFAFSMGGAAFTWSSKKQPIVTLSTCEVEYVAAAHCVCHAIWLRNLLHDMKVPQHEPTEIRIDNKSAIELAKNPGDHERTKHIDVRFHFIREHIKDKTIRVVHVQSNDQAADILTKALAKPLFEKGKQMLGMMDGRDLTLREDVGKCKLQVSDTNPDPMGGSNHSGAEKLSGRDDCAGAEKLSGEEKCSEEAKLSRDKTTRSDREEGAREAHQLNESRGLEKRKETRTRDIKPEIAREDCSGGLLE